ncbi:hypothetical protein HaLaN_18705 [Haematococcus lacustris]|uniref:Uncharacterized protein n=1 Tax=Haematococcus lacustris TaxID=44745 RepID=A0A699ZRL3_HAELA|nr:hypothetical protein HaLaN_18705 [Haematococcus lacustris]
MTTGPLRAELQELQVVRGQLAETQDALTAALQASELSQQEAEYLTRQLAQLEAEARSAAIAAGQESHSSLSGPEGYEEGTGAKPKAEMAPAPNQWLSSDEDLDWDEISDIGSLDVGEERMSWR